MKNDNATDHSKVLISLDMIADHIKVSKPTARNLIKAGMPAVSINGTWYSHVESVETYFKSICEKYKGKEINFDLRENHVK